MAEERDLSRRVAAPGLPAALAYARRGIPVFPCRPGGKEPITPGGFADATLEEHRVRSWWTSTPAANVAVPTGRRSGLLVLDVDLEAGGFDSLAALERVEPLPKTTTAATGGGGLHVFFRYPRELHHEVRNSASLLGAGLDVRGEGGYVVVSPSATRRRYRWISRAPLAESRWLSDRLRELEGPTLF